MSTKADMPQDQRDKLASKGQAMSGGRFPITNADDLDNAIQAVGRANGGEAGRRAVRRFILSRAKALGLTNRIPDGWRADGSVDDSDNDGGSNDYDADDTGTKGYGPSGSNKGRPQTSGSRLASSKKRKG